MEIIFKVLKFTLLGILGLFIAAMLFFFLILHSNNTVKGNKIDTIKTSYTTSSKALVVYQPSLITNSTHDIAYEIAKGLNSDGYEVTLTNPGKHISTDISAYKIVVFGSPVYMGQTSSVLNDYIKSINSFEHQKVILFVTGGADDSEQLTSLEKLLTKVKSPTKIAFKYNDTKNKIEAFNLGVETGKE